MTLKQVEAQHKHVADALASVNTELLSIRDATDAIANAVAGAWTIPPKVRPAIVSVEQAVGRAGRVSIIGTRRLRTNNWW